MERAAPASSHAEPVRLSAEADFALGDLELHPSTREARRGAVRHVVEPRVMQVLVALARAKGAVVSREELIASCWDGRVVGEAAINRCIFKLRELADLGGGEPAFAIETIARVGYRLAARDRVDNATPSLEPRAPARTRSASIAAIAALVLIAATGSWFAWRHREPAPVPAEKPSIAVLPLKDLSADGDAGYLAAGIQDEILTRLAKIGSLKVISRTSASEVARRPGALKDIARELGVANVLEGSVQRVGNTVRINVQLIRVASEDHLWAEDYDRTLDDVLSVENEVAGSIAAALAAKIKPSESAAFAEPATATRQAYDLYLRGLVLFRKGGANLVDAANVLEQAVAIDPAFAAAWALLSRANGYAYFGGEGGESRRTAARRALDKALALKPEQLEVELANGMYAYHVEHDFRGALRALQALQAKWPGNVEVLQALALISRRLGHWPESIAYFREVVTLDPLVALNHDQLATTLAMSRDTRGALKALDDALALWPDDAELLAHRIDLLQSLGELDQADTALERIPAANLDVYTRWIRRVHYAYRRRFADGSHYFESVRAQPETAGWPPEQRGYLDLFVGDFLRQNGNAQAAKTSYESVLASMQPLLDEQPDNTDVLTPVSIAYSGLGDETAAMRHADHAAALHPLGDDPVDGAALELYRATALSRVGDRDAAIPALAKLLTIPGTLTVAMLRLDPDFDRLRGDPRFDRLLASEAASPP